MEEAEDFPRDRVIADDDPLLKYFRWFWTVGDGWNSLHTAVHRGIHSTGRDDVWTWFDPAIRAASIAGSVARWTCLGSAYTNPDPLRIERITDELLAMEEATQAARDENDAALPVSLLTAPKK